MFNHETVIGNGGDRQVMRAPGDAKMMTARSIEVQTQEHPSGESCGGYFESK